MLKDNLIDTQKDLSLLKKNIGISKAVKANEVKKFIKKTPQKTLIGKIAKDTYLKYSFSLQWDGWVILFDAIERFLNFLEKEVFNGKKPLPIIGKIRFFFKIGKAAYRLVLEIIAVFKRNK